MSSIYTDRRAKHLSQTGHQATDLRTYDEWKLVGRQVKQGEECVLTRRYRGGVYVSLFCYCQTY